MIIRAIIFLTCLLSKPWVPSLNNLSKLHCESYGLISYQEYDPTNGYVNYLDESDAQNANLISVDNGVVTIRSDSTNIASGRGRNSVRISSRNQYTHGLVVLDLQHMPSAACGIWPAFWSTGPSVSYFPTYFLSVLCPKPQRPFEESAWDILTWSITSGPTMAKSTSSKASTSKRKTQ